MRRINTIVQRCEKILGSILVACILILVLTNIVFRYFLKSPIMWSDEVSAFALIWITFLAIPYLFSTGEHVSLSLLRDRLSPPARRFINIACDAAAILGFSLLLPGCLKSIKFLSLSPALRLPLKYIYVVMPLSYFLILFHGIVNILETVSPSGPRPEEKR